MIGRYLGHLDRYDPLYEYLRDHILPQLGVELAEAGFRVFQSASSHNVYFYEERQSGARMVGKFHPPRNPSGHYPKTGEIEFANLIRLRRLGFKSFPHYVVNPLGFNPIIGNVLITEYLEGSALGKVIEDAMHLGRCERLYRKLTALAHFLATLHHRTAEERRVDFEPCYDYLGRIIRALMAKLHMDADDAGELYRLREVWRNESMMWEDHTVVVHGDVTPSNFLFGSGHTVMAIDLERMQWADRAFDLGRLCGELAHYFYQGRGHPGAAEPFIGHFLWEYCRHFPDQMSSFRAITRRIPFYMGITLLRIARNWWLDRDYRWRLVRQGKTILRAVP